MTTYAVIMLPGEWMTDEGSLGIASVVAPLEGTLPIDVQRRLRLVGYAIQGVPGELAQRTAMASTDLGHDARVVAMAKGGWQHPRIVHVSMVQFDAETLRYEAGTVSGEIEKSDVLFIHLGIIQGSSAEPDLQMDIHVADPRSVLSLGIKGTRFSFPGEGAASPQYIQPARALMALVPWSLGKLVVPDSRLLSTALADDLWSQAVCASEQALRSRAAWYRQLAEHGFLKSVTEVSRDLQRSTIRRAESAALSSRSERTGSVGNLLAEQVLTVDRWLGRGMHKRALREADKAVSMRPDRAEGYRARAKVHLAMGHEELADDDMATADRIEDQR